MNVPHPNPDGESSPDGPSDFALMQLVKGGDTEAFEQIVIRHQHAVVGTVAKMLGDASEAEDVAQMVFVRVWKSAARYEPSAKFTTWLMTIARNLVFNEMRRRSRARLQPMETGEEDEPHHQFADAGTPAPNTKLLDTELQGAIEEAIASLPENQRVAIVLRRYENMPYEEIAKVLKTSVPAVKSILFRARADLKERLSRYLG